MLARVQNDPLSLMNQWRRDIERAFNSFEDGAYVVHADIPGVDPKNIELNMENGVLTLRGERKSEVKEEKDNYHRIERITGSFYRRFTLPDTADSDNISAKYTNGVLEVRIPKQEKVLPRRIEVQS
jgi:HSP20 family protein